jgi:hypothetical protein
MRLLLDTVPVFKWVMMNGEVDVVVVATQKNSKFISE